MNWNIITDIPLFVKWFFQIFREISLPAPHEIENRPVDTGRFSLIYLLVFLPVLNTLLLSSYTARTR